MLASGLDPKEGMARQKAQTYGSVSVAGYGGRLSARHMRFTFYRRPKRVSEGWAHAHLAAIFAQIHRAALSSLEHRAK